MSKRSRRTRRGTARPLALPTARTASPPAPRPARHLTRPRAQQQRTALVRRPVHCEAQPTHRQRLAARRHDGSDLAGPTRTVIGGSRRGCSRRSRRDVRWWPGNFIPRGVRASLALEGFDEVGDRPVCRDGFDLQSRIRETRGRAMRSGVPVRAVRAQWVASAPYYSHRSLGGRGEWTRGTAGTRRPWRGEPAEMRG